MGWLFCLVRVFARPTQPQTWRWWVLTPDLYYYAVDLEFTPLSRLRCLQALGRCGNQRLWCIWLEGDHLPAFSLILLNISLATQPCLSTSSHFFFQPYPFVFCAFPFRLLVDEPVLHCAWLWYSIFVDIFHFRSEPVWDGFPLCNGGLMIQWKCSSMPSPGVGIPLSNSGLKTLCTSLMSFNWLWFSHFVSRKAWTWWPPGCGCGVFDCISKTWAACNVVNLITCLKFIQVYLGCMLNQELVRTRSYSLHFATPAP